MDGRCLSVEVDGFIGGSCMAYCEYLLSMRNDVKIDAVVVLYTTDDVIQTKPNPRRIQRPSIYANTSYSIYYFIVKLTGGAQI